MSAPVLMLAGGGLAARAGGVGTLIANLQEYWACTPGAPRLRVLDTRGGGGRLVSVGHWARAAWTLARARPGLVHAHMATRGSAWRKAALIVLAHGLGRKVVLHLHGADFPAFYRGLPARARGVLAYAMRRADRVLVLGDAWRDFLIAEVGVPAARVAILPNGVPAPAARPALRAPGPARILFLGQIGARKGVGDLIDALAMLRATPWRATIAGDGDTTRYRSAASSAGLGDRIAFPGWLDRGGAAAALAAADLLVLPSYREALPMAVLEALAVGTPVITTPVGMLAEYLRDNETALLVPPGDVPALAGAIARLLAEPETGERLAQAGRALFARAFSIDAAAARLAAIYAALEPAVADA